MKCWLFLQHIQGGTSNVTQRALGELTLTSGKVPCQTIIALLHAGVCGS